MRISEFAKAVADLQEHAFISRYPHPFLLIVPGPETVGGRAYQTAAFETAVVEEMMRAAAGDPLVFPVKREGGEDNALVTVGRAGNMCIVLKSPVVSKMHAYFQKQVPSGEWTVADVGSRNGTLLNGKPLKKGTPCPIRDGDKIGFGGIFFGTFLSSLSMYRASRATQR